MLTSHVGLNPTQAFFHPNLTENDSFSQLSAKDLSTWHFVIVAWRQVL